MKNSTRIVFQAFLLLFLGLTACKEGETIIVPDNNSPGYEGVASIVIENYINRLYIDLLGREPLDNEMTRDLEALRAGGLSPDSRKDLVTLLQSGTDFIEGDSSYRYAYYRRFYEFSKARMLEGVAESEVNRRIGLINNDILRDSLLGDWVQYQIDVDKRMKLTDLLASHRDYRDGRIDVRGVYARMLDNSVYDFINMNSINFIRACFDDLFFRFHTQAEFDQSFPIIEYNIAGSIFGLPASNKTEYVNILVNSREFHEGMIRWAYKSLLARDPNSVEVETAMKDFFTDRDFQKVQLNLLITDEYAGF